jgi:hypothetical protein
MHSKLVQGLGSQEGPPRLFYGLSQDAMVGEYVFSSVHNFSFTPKLVTSFCPSYFMAQEASATPKFFAIR